MSKADMTFSELSSELQQALSAAMEPEGQSRDINLAYTSDKGPVHEPSPASIALQDIPKLRKGRLLSKTAGTKSFFQHNTTIL